MNAADRRRLTPALGIVAAIMAVAIAFLTAVGPEARGVVFEPGAGDVASA